MRYSVAKFWTSINLFLALLIVITLGTPVIWSFLGLAVILLNPTYIQAIATVSNDAAVVSAVLFWVFIELSLKKYKLSPRIAVAARVITGLIFGLTKGTLLIIPASALTIQIAIWVIKDRTNLKIKFFTAMERLTSLPLFVSSVTTYLAFMAWQSWRSSTPSETVLEALLGFSKTDLPNPQTYSQSLDNLLSTFKGAYSLGAPIDDLVSQLATLGVISFLSISTFKSIRSEMLVRNAPYAILFPGLLFTISTILLTVAWPTLTYIQGNYDFAASNRYALMLLPILSFAIWTPSKTMATLGKTHIPIKLDEINKSEV
jgi:hypothetical protein